MSGPVTITAYGTPQPAGSKTAGRTRDGRTFVRDSNKNAAAWKHTIAQAAGQVMNGRELLDGPLRLAVVFHLARPKSHHGKRGLLPSAPRHPTVRPDTTKLLRAAEDALQGIVYRDDAQIVQQLAAKRYGTPERVEITVTPIDLESEAA